MDTSDDSANSNDERNSPEKAPATSNSEDACLFIDDEGEPLSFILCLRSYPDIQKYSQLIEDHFGIVKKLRDFGDYDAVLVKDNINAWSHNGDVFQVSYIKECVKKGELLDISKFRCNPNSQFTDNFNYMDIIYKRRYTWTSVPQEFLKPKKGPNPVLTVDDRLLNDDDAMEVDSNQRSRSPEVDKQNAKKGVNSARHQSDDDDDTETVSSQRAPSPGGVDKRTKSLFSVREKRAMVDYIFERKEFDQLKGNVFWKKMEERNICPIRTWQSMKNHFSKSLSYELDNYNLPEEDYNEFRKWYYNKNTLWMRSRKKVKVCSSNQKDPLGVIL